MWESWDNPWLGNWDSIGWRATTPVCCSHDGDLEQPKKSQKNWKNADAIYYTGTPHYPLCPAPGRPPLYFLCLWFWFLHALHVGGLLQYLSFWDRLVSLSRVSSRFICVVPCGRNSFLHHQILMESLLGNLGCRVFSCIILNISCHSPLACRVSAEKSAVSLMGIPLLFFAFPCGF